MGTEDNKDPWEPVSSCAPITHHMDPDFNSPELLGVFPWVGMNGGQILGNVVPA